MIGDYTIVGPLFCFEIQDSVQFTFRKCSFWSTCLVGSGWLKCKETWGPACGLLADVHGCKPRTVMNTLGLLCRYNHLEHRKTRPRSTAPRFPFLILLFLSLFSLRTTIASLDGSGMMLTRLPRWLAINSFKLRRNCRHGSIHGGVRDGFV